MVVLHRCVPRGLKLQNLNILLYKVLLLCRLKKYSLRKNRFVFLTRIYQMNIQCVDRISNLKINKYNFSNIKFSGINFYQILQYTP